MTVSPGAAVVTATWIELKPAVLQFVFSGKDAPGAT